jgi:hypothetical protein
MGISPDVLVEKGDYEVVAHILVEKHAVVGDLRQRSVMAVALCGQMYVIETCESGQRVDGVLGLRCQRKLLA